MAKYTENFSLIKPDNEDYYDVEDFNANMDIIDEELGAVAEQASSGEVLDKIGTPVDNVASTVFGKMNGFISEDGKGVRIIKSIQHRILNFSINSFTAQTSIAPIDSSRSIVIFERLGDLSKVSAKVTYTLTDTTISAEYQNGSYVTFSLGFWIIEFY